MTHKDGYSRHRVDLDSGHVKTAQALPYRKNVPAYNLLKDRVWWEFWKK